MPAPTDEEVDALALKVARRVTVVVERLCADTFETDALLEQTAAALQQAHAPKPLCARVAGFSLHAAQSVAADDREGLEQLCRYGLRPPFSREHLALRADGRVLYHLRRLAPLMPAP